MEETTELEDRLERALAGIPHMTPAQGRAVSRFIREHRLRECLELGFAHGAGTAWIAAAAGRIGGRVAAIDLEFAKRRSPDIEETLARAGIAPDTVEIHFEPTSYTWRLMKFLRDGRAGGFDFIYLDGAHSWFVDGFAFFLCERLLRPGGWLLFDDLDWTFAGSSVAHEDWVRRMPDEERGAPQMRLVWDILVKGTPGVDLLLDEGNWGFARKAERASERTVVYRHHPLARAAIDLARYAKRRLRRHPAAARLALDVPRPAERGGRR